MLCLALPVAVNADRLNFDSSLWSDRVTRCDRLAAHPLDPHRVASGVSQRDIDLDAAIRACERAVAEDPEHPRLNYQLARVYGYSGRGREAVPHRAVAVAGDYPQAVFVVGFLHLHGMNHQPRDVCRAAELIHRSARLGRLAGQVAYPRYVLQGRFDDCDAPRDRDALDALLREAEATVGGDFYRTMLVEMLREAVAALPGDAD